MTAVAIEIYALIAKGRISEAISRIKSAKKSDVEALKKMLIDQGLWATLDQALKDAIENIVPTRRPPRP